MNTINIKRFGMAFGITGAILYFGCIILMATVGREGSIFFFNNLLHGLDTSSIIRMNVPVWEACIGIIEIFILSWLVGVCIASIYNIAAKK
ncbi:MAG: hypothetical protein C0591_09560 [Marinilabiliales bacterium]|nr:MAG: hypothetical protein C0591_09560 [Marinilabiliales bacterium]